MQSLVIEDPGKKDRRINLAMEDSASMTIEFLRARLLSERSVSRTARQRADQLAKRVMQLEEQLRVVITQRRKAEKAAAGVLEILENHGVNDFSEAFDSNSDEDGVVDVSKESDGSTKEEGNSLTSKLRRDDLEDGLSSSELEACRTPGRSLSWKSGSHSSHEKNFADGRRHRTFLSTGRSYPKLRVGKSCRQIKRRETREVAESARDASQDGVSAGRDDISINFLGRPENGVSPCQEEKASSYDPCSSVDQREENGSGLRGTDHRDREMEIALEQQAQLIGRYEAEENAQREWEEKYQEDNGCTLDLREPGTQSDITDERTPPNTHSAELAGVLPSSEEEAKPKADKVQGSKEEPVTTTFNDLVASHETYYQSSIHKLPSTMLKKGSRESEPTGQVYSGDQEAKEKQKQAWSVDNHNRRDVLSNSKLNAVSHGPESSEVGMGGSCVSPFKEQLTSQKTKQAGNPSQTTANGLSGVLEALQFAKLSLHQELTILPSSSHHVTPDTQSLAWKKSSDLMEIPVGCTSLFRLPSELQRSSSQGDLWRNPSYSDLGLSITRHRSEAGLGISADNRNLSYTLDNDPAVSAKMYPGRSYGDPYLDSAAMEIRPPYHNTSFNELARLPSPSHYHRSDQVRMPPTSPYYYYSAQMPPLAPYHYPNSKTGLNDRQ